MFSKSFFVFALPLLAGALALDNSTSYSNSKSSLRIIYQNNLNGTDDANHIGFLLLDPVLYTNASASCAAIGESLISYSFIQAHQRDFARPLAYLNYVGDVRDKQNLWVQNGSVTLPNSNPNANITFSTLLPQDAGRINQTYGRGQEPMMNPVLCTQSSVSTSDTITNRSKTISIPVNGNAFTGFVNKKAFSFQGVRYASQPARFKYSTVYAPKNTAINATAYGSKCTASEDCLFLNIQTPYIPKAGQTGRLRPVLFWIHGGGFTGGAGSEGYDGSNLASKEDVVVVTINYRLSTLGFLTVPNTTVTGNYGIQDQITALDWTIANIAAFGGNPQMITIAGESAGAGSIRVLLGSPKAIGKFQGGISMSNLGGGVDLGLSGDYGTTYSSYLTSADSFSRAGSQIFSAAGCNQTSTNAKIACLTQVNATKILGFNTVARYVTQDGVIVNTPNLLVASGRNPNTAYVPVIFGTTHDDGASFSNFPPKNITTESQGIQAALGISASYAQAIIDSGLFPFYNTGNLTLDSFNVSARVATDKTFRCVDEATVYAAIKSGAFPTAYYYQMDRTIDGYDPNHLGGPAGDNPELPYFRLHGADIPWLLGGIPRLRNANDLYSLQLSTSYFGSFIKTGKTEINVHLESLRGYDKVVEAVRSTGQWDPVQGDQGPVRHIDYPTSQGPFVDAQQCTWLNYTLSYYLTGGK